MSMAELEATVSALARRVLAAEYEIDALRANQIGSKARTRRSGAKHEAVREIVDKLQSARGV